jgi:hypothetical protein
MPGISKGALPMRRLLSLALTLAALAILISSPTYAQANTRYFSQTGHTVSGKFLTYWNTHGGLAQQGYPISDQLQEVSDVNGKTYTVQYFERAEFELHPENQPPNDVELSLLGSLRLAEKYPSGNPTSNGAPGPGYFPETRHTVTGRFLEYWQTHGGLAQQGYPITEAFQEKSDLNGQTYTVQYFERAVFELHPENQPPNDVLLSLLGTFRFKEKYPNGPPAGTGGPPPPAAPTATAVPVNNYAASASVDNAAPHHNQTVTVLGTVRSGNGAGVAGAEMRTIWHYKSTDSGCNGGPTDANGNARCSRDISTASYGFQVNIDVTFLLPNGQTLQTRTSFTPQQ